MSTQCIAAAVSLSSQDWVGSAALVLGVLMGIALLLVYPAMVFRKYVRIMVNIMEDHAPQLDNGGHDGANLEGEQVSFRAVDGHRLEGIILAGRGGRRKLGMVVFAHEFGSDRASCLRYCQSLLRAGYDVFAFDFRGHGGSAPQVGYRPRQWPSNREHADMLGAIAFIGSWLEQHGRPRDVGLFGISRGGGAAILASLRIESVRAIVTDGAFSTDTEIEYLMRRFATIFAKIRIVAENHPPTTWRVLRWLLFREYYRKFHCQFPSVRKAAVRLGRVPILLIHGEKDSYIPIAQSQALYDLAEGPKSLWIVPGAKHNQSIMVRPEEYARRLLRFFHEHLAGVEPVDETPLVEPVQPGGAQSVRRFGELAGASAAVRRAPGH